MQNSPKILCLFGSIAACALSVNVHAQGSTAQERYLEAFRLRVAAWDKEAKLVRSSKAIPDVKKATPLLLADEILTGKKAGVAVQAGAVGYQKIAKDSAVRYASIEPPSLDPVSPSDVQIELKRGSVQHRTGKLAAGSVYRSRSGPRLAASTGTAYSVVATETGLDVVVAEGEVKVSLDGKSGELAVGPRKRVSISDTVPAQALPVADADEPLIRNLLSLPYQSLIGYTDPDVLRRKNATEIVTLRVRDALLVERAKESEAKWRPFSIVVTAEDDFWTVDEAGGRHHVGKGFKFLEATKNGKTVLALSAEGNLEKIDLATGQVRAVLPKVSKFYGLSLDGTYAVVRVSRTQLKDRSTSGTTTYKTSHNLGLVRTASGSMKILANPFQSDFEPTFVAFRPKGVFLVSTAMGKTRVMNALSRNDAGPTGKSAAIVLDSPTVGAVDISKRGDLALISSPDKKIVLDTESHKSTALPAGATVVEQVDGTLRVTVSGKLPQTVKASGEDAAPVLAEAPSDPPNLERFAVSPNGELVTFKPTDHETILVADASNLLRRSDSYVKFAKDYECEWVSGNEVWYKGARFYDASATGRTQSDEIIITLGIKRAGARPKDFPPNPAGLAGLPRADFDLGPLIDGSQGLTANEVIVSAVSETGVVVGFGKDEGDVFGGFRLDLRAGGEFEPIEVTPLGLAENGTIFAFGSTVLSDGRVVRYPTSTVGLGMDARGRILLADQVTTVVNGRLSSRSVGKYIWDPYATSEGTNPYFDLPGNAHEMKNAPAGARAESINRAGDILWRADDGTFWIGQPDEAPRLGEFKLPKTIFFLRESMGDDGFAYGQGGSFVQGRTTTQFYRIELAGAPKPLVRGGIDGSYFLRGISKEGIVYAEGPEDCIVVVKGKAYRLNDLLEPGVTARSIRQINAKGDIGGEFFKDGKPIGTVPNIHKLLRNRE